MSSDDVRRDCLPRWRTPSERVFWVVADEARDERQSTGASSSKFSEALERDIEFAEMLALLTCRSSSLDEMRSEDQKTSRNRLEREREMGGP